MKSQTQKEKEARQQAQKLRRANSVVSATQSETLAELVARHANRPKVHVQTLAELQAENQEQLAASLGKKVLALVAAGDEVAAGHLATNAAGKVNNAWRLRNPEPMMTEVHKFFLRKNGCNVDFANKFKAVSQQP